MPSEQSTQIKGNCPECASPKWADIKALHDHHWEDENPPISGVNYYRILQCCGCRTIYYQKGAQHSEDYDNDYHPITGEEICIYHERTEH